jgi:hypothetical protein
MARNTTYFSDWKTGKYDCDCGWTGSASELTKDYFAELMAYACPTCDRNLVLVSFPSADEVEAAAATGDEEAKSMLADIRKGTR